MGHTYIIAEIGQNHNGDIDLAKKLIDIAAVPVFDFFGAQQLPGVDAVKFTKRDLTEELTEEEGRRPYVSPHSFGATYLEHRQALEFSIEQHAELEAYARSKGLDFIETLCSPGCLKLLDQVNVDAVKIASRDVTNIPLLEQLGARDKRIIISSGMSNLEELRTAIGILSRRPKQIDILHCISQYPAEYANMNLRSITYLQKMFPDHLIGYSDHSIGIMIPAVAVALGAAIIEKHITLNRNLKGSDHHGSLEPEGVWRMVRDIRNVERALGEEHKEVSPAVHATQSKLARSLAIRSPMRAGDVLTEQNICMLSPGTGLRWEARCELVGKRACRDLPGRTLIQRTDFE